MIARSTGPGTSAMVGAHGSPNSSLYFGLTGCTAPSNPPAVTSWIIICSPNDPGVALAPTTATERASSIVATGVPVIAASVAGAGEGFNAGGEL